MYAAGIAKRSRACGPISGLIALIEVVRVQVLSIYGR